MSVEDVRNEIVDLRNGCIETREEASQNARDFIGEQNIHGYIVATAEVNVLIQATDLISELLEKFDEEFSHGT